MKTKISDVLSHKGSAVHEIEVGKSVADAVNAMTEFGIGSLLVRDGERIVGIVTERDLAHRCVTVDVDITRIPVESIMTSPVAFIHPDNAVSEALKVMSESHHRHLPVYDEDKLVGIVSQGDLMRWVTRELVTHVNYLESYIRGK